MIRLNEYGNNEWEEDRPLN